MKRKKINSKLENKILFSNKINLLEINYGTIFDWTGNLHRRGIRDKHISGGEINSLKEKESGGVVKGTPPLFCFSEIFLGFLKF